MNGTKNLVSASGQPLISEPKLIVLKRPRDIHLDPRMVQGLAVATHCSVIELPMDAELMMGELASKELDSVHHAIHHITGIPDINFTKSDLQTLYSAMRFLCEKTSPTDGSNEVILMKRIKSKVE